MAGEQDLSRMERRQAVGTIEVPVRGEDCPGALAEQGVVGHDREAKHRLVDLRVAVAAHAEHTVRHRVELCGDLLRRIVARQIVARPVIEHVAEQEHPLRPFALKAFHDLAAVIRRAVDIRSDQPFHPSVSSLFLFSHHTAKSVDRSTGRKDLIDYLRFCTLCALAPPRERW